MGETDQMDQSMHTYGINVRNRKLYWPLVLFVLEASMYNAWLLHKKLHYTTEKVSHLNFIRYITKAYLPTYGVSRAIPGKKPCVLYNASQVAKRVAETVRYDKV